MPTPHFSEMLVYRAGQAGYHTFRIPAIVRNAEGVLLAFAEGRRHSYLDYGDIDIVVRRSADGGGSWGEIQVVDTNGPHTAGNPVPIVDRQTPGHLCLVTTRNHAEDTKATLFDGSAPGARTAWVQHSTDHGMNWGEATEITSAVKAEHWLWYATGPGHGIQLERGRHTGRMVVPINFNGHEENGAGVILSDDGGHTWTLGGTVTAAKHDLLPSESSALELMNGDIYLNSRRYDNRLAGRAYALSHDGGQSFTEAGEAEQLIDPMVQGSTLRYAAADRGDAESRIVFSNPAHRSKRRMMTVKSSFDEGKSWDRGRLIYDGHTAYSDLVRTDLGVGLLYERGDASPYEQIVFAHFDTAWLDQSGR